MNTKKHFLIALLVLLIGGPPADATTVGLSSNSVNSIYAEQKQSEWCWAACIQMITNLYGADLTQDEVVARTYGPGVNRAGTLDVITSNLNGSGTTHSGRRYTITSRMLSNRMLPAALVEELTAGRPVMLGCDEGGSGHAVVCTAVTYQGSASNPTITVLTVRDPWPSASNRAGSGRQTLSGSDLGPRIMEGWVIHISVHESDGSDVPAPQGYVFNDPDAAPDATNDTPPSMRPSQVPAMVWNNRRNTRSDDDEPGNTGASAASAAAMANRTHRHPLVEAAEEMVNQFEAIMAPR